MAFSPDKMTRASDMIHAYNSEVDVELQFPIEELEQRLKKLGAVSDNDLQDLSWEKLQDMGLPFLVAKRIAIQVFRSNVTDEGSKRTVVWTRADEASELGNPQLLEQFAENPTALHNAIAEQIRVRSKGLPCIAFLANGTIDVETSAKALDGIAQGDSYGDIIRVEGRPRYLYKLGDAAGSVRDMHPVFSGQILLLDGSDKHGINWTKVPLDCRQLVWLAHNETHELKVADKERLLDLRDRALQGFDVLTERYPNAYRLFEERKDIGNLPCLKTRMKPRQPESTAA